MVEECRETRIHGRFGWNAMPLARELLDSNCDMLEQCFSAASSTIYLGQHSLGGHVGGMGEHDVRTMVGGVVNIRGEMRARIANSCETHVSAWEKADKKTRDMEAGRRIGLLKAACQGNSGFISCQRGEFRSCTSLHFSPCILALPLGLEITAVLALHREL
jgi:hypothetical protein